MEFAKRLAYDWFGLNQELFMLVNGPSGVVAQAWAHAGAWVGTLRMLGLVGAGLLLALYLFHRRGAQAAMRKVARLFMEFVLSAALLGCAAIGLQQALLWPTPADILPAEVSVLGPQHFVAGFPSAQAGYAVLLAALLWPHAGHRGKAMAVLLASAVGVSRVAAGASFPADVLAGALLGYLAVMSARALLVRAEQLADRRPVPRRRGAAGSRKLALRPPAAATIAAATPSLRRAGSGRRSR